VQHIADAEAVTDGLTRVAWANSALGGADGFAWGERDFEWDKYVEEGSEQFVCEIIIVAWRCLRLESITNELLIILLNQVFLSFQPTTPPPHLPSQPPKVHLQPGEYRTTDWP
jgi:hypothetical protein